MILLQKNELDQAKEWERTRLISFYVAASAITMNGTRLFPSVRKPSDILSVITDSPVKEHKINNERAQAAFDKYKNIRDGTE